MREILFRGKEGRTNKWVYGSLLTAYTPNDEPYYTIVVDGGVYVRVIPETIGQYTGLKGYNGKKIFEGDILRIGTCSQAFCVEWDEEKAMFQVFTQYSEYVEAQFDEIKGCIEVVGNIHDNPELLNKLLK
jgi:uncharacterized phage protein (TIGR01671 family)